MRQRSSTKLSSAAVVGAAAAALVLSGCSENSSPEGDNPSSEIERGSEQGEGSVELLQETGRAVAERVHGLLLRGQSAGGTELYNTGVNSRGFVTTGRGPDLSIRSDPAESSGPAALVVTIDSEEHHAVMEFDTTAHEISRLDASQISPQNMIDALRDPSVSLIETTVLDSPVIDPAESLSCRTTDVQPLCIQNDGLGNGVDSLLSVPSSEGTLAASRSLDQAVQVAEERFQ